MAIGYLVLTVAYYKNLFHAKDLVFMSTSLFGSDGSSYNQSAILTPEYTLDPTKLQEVGFPRYTTTYVISQICYNLSLGAAIVHVVLWHWDDLRRGEQYFVLERERTPSPFEKPRIWGFPIFQKRPRHQRPSLWTSVRLAELVDRLLTSHLDRDEEIPRGPSMVVSPPVCWISWGGNRL